MKKQTLLLLTILLLGAFNGFSQKTYQPNWESIESPIAASLPLSAEEPEHLVATSTATGARLMESHSKIFAVRGKMESCEIRTPIALY